MKRTLHILRLVVALKCEEADRLRAIGPKELAWYERLAERLHRLVCGACRRARRQLELLRRATEALRRETAQEGAAAGAGPQDTLKLPPAARERISAALRNPHGE